MVANGFDRRRSALRLAHHPQQASLFQHLAGELVHARGGRGAGRTNHFIPNRINRSHVIDKAIGEVHGKLLALAQFLRHPFVRGIAAREQLAAEQENIAGLPGRHFLAGDAVEVYPPRANRIVGQLRPVVKRRQFQRNRSRAIKNKMRMARRGAVGNHRHWQVCGVRRVVLHLHVNAVVSPPSPCAPMPRALIFLSSSSRNSPRE